MLEFSHSQGTLEERVLLQGQGEPESFVEVSVPLEAAETLYYTWSAKGEVAFNIHAHPEKRVEYHEQRQAESGEGEFSAPRRDHFYLMWQNPGTAPLELHFRVHWGP